MLETEDVESRLEASHDGGSGADSVGAEGGLTRSGRVFGPDALNDIFERVTIVRYTYDYCRLTRR